MLTTECVPPARQLNTNGDLARALLDSRECLAISAIQLQAIAELADCREEQKGVSYRDRHANPINGLQSLLSR